MAFQIADLYATIRADDAQMQTALPTLQSKLKRLQVQMEKVARVARRMLLVIGGVLALTIKHASTAEEMHAKFMTVFRDEGDAVAKWAAQYGRAVGRSKVDMETWLATIQDTFVPLGIARTEATRLSKIIVKLGIDLASFNEEADVTAIGNLQSALVGQSRAVLKYGIVIRESAVKQEVWRMGVRKAWDDVSTATKVQARMNIILRSSTDAQGDAIRTIGSFANQLKLLRARWKDAAAVIGQAFIPAAIRVMETLREMLGPIAEWVRQNMRLTAGIGGVTVALLGLLSVLPLLISGLAVLAAHPVLAAVIALGAAAAATTIYLYAMRRAAVEAFGFERPMETSKQLKRRIDMLHTLIRTTEKEIKLRQQMELVPGAGAPAIAVLRKDLEAYTGAVEQLITRLKLVEAAEMAATEARKKAAAAVKKAKDEADAAAAAALTLAKEEQAAAEAKLALAQKEARAEAKKLAIIERANEAIRRGAAARAAEAAAARAPGGRMAPAFTGITELFKRIQSAILRSREEAEQRRLIKEGVKLDRQQLATQKLMLTAIQAINIVPGLILTP